MGYSATREGLSYFGLIFDIYSSLRRLGFSIDFLSPEATNFNDYKLIIASGMMHTPEKLKELLQIVLLKYYLDLEVMLNQKICILKPSCLQIYQK